MFTTSHFGALTHSHAGERILYRVRVRLVDEWQSTDRDPEWRYACVLAIGEVDACLTALRKVRRV